RRRKGRFGRRNASRVRLAAQSVEQRYPEKSAGAARRDSRVATAKKWSRERCARGSSHWGYHCRTAAGAEQEATAHSRYYTGISLSAAHFRIGPTHASYDADAHHGGDSRCRGRPPWRASRLERREFSCVEKG